MSEPERISGLLSEAALRGNLSKVKNVISTFKLSHRDAWPKGCDILYSAIYHNRSQIVDLLLLNNCPVNSIIPNVDTPLHLAILKGNGSLVNALLSKGASIDAQDKLGCTSLHVAIKSGRSPIIRSLLNRGGNLNIPDNTSSTPFNEALKKKDLELVTLLLKYGASLVEKCDADSTPLHVAVKMGNLKLVQLLLSKGAPINAVNDNNQTPLQLSFNCKNTNKIAQLLLKSGASVHLQDPSEPFMPQQHAPGARWSPDSPNLTGECLLYFAVEENYYNVAKLLLEKKVDPNVIPMGNITLLHITMIRGRLKMGNLLLKYGASTNLTEKQKKICSTSPLRYAIHHSDVDFAKTLIKKKANVNEKLDDGTNLLYLCASLGKGYIFDLLVDHKAKVDLTMEKDGKTILHHMVEKGSAPILGALMVSYVKEVRAVWNDLIREADKKGNNKMILEIVRAGFYGKLIQDALKNIADINVSVECPDGLCNKNSTLLHNAIEYKQIETVEVLLDFGAKFDVADHNGKDALDRAIDKADCREEDEELEVEIAESLLKRGCDFDWKYAKADRALHRTILGYSDVADYLLQYDVNPDCQNKDGMTALFVAAKQGNTEMFKTLIDYGADINHVDETRGTLVDFINSGAIRNDCTGDRKKPVFECLQRKVLRLKVAGFHLSETYANLTSEDVSQEFQEKCTVEIANWKNTPIGNSGISVYDVLIMPLTKLLQHVKNKQFVADFKAIDLWRYKYGSWVSNKFAKAKTRCELMDEFQVTLRSIFAFLPEVCVQEIISFLTNQELRRLVCLSKIQV